MAENVRTASQHNPAHQSSASRPASTSGTIRVSVVGDARRIDVVVPIWTEVNELAGLFMRETGSRGVGLLTVAGRSLEPAMSMHDAGLRDGSLLVAAPQPGRRARRMLVDPTSEPSLDASEDHLDSGRRATHAEEPASVTPGWDATWALPLWAGPAAVAALSAGITVTAMMAAGSFVGSLSAIGLVLLAVLTAFLASDRRRSDATWLATIPLHAAGAAVLLLPPDSSTLLTVGAAGLAAAAVAAAMRTAAPDVADDELLTWTIGAALVAVVATVCLLASWPPATFYACVITASIIGIRAIPARAVRVPDHVLLDFDRLAVTAWTARETPRRSFRGVIRHDDVTSVARRGSELLASGTVWCSVTIVAGAAALLLADHSGARRVGTLLLCLGASGVLILSGRFRRDRAARRLQRTVGTIMVTATALWWIVDLGPQWRVRLIVACLVIGVLALLAARGVSRGWTSVWWSRRAEVAETLAGVLVFGSLPLVTGLFDWMRVLTSR